MPASVAADVRTPREQQDPLRSAPHRRMNSMALELNSLRNGTGNFRLRIRENFSRNGEFFTRNAWISNFEQPQGHIGHLAENLAA